MRWSTYSLSRDDLIELWDHIVDMRWSRLSNNDLEELDGPLGDGYQSARSSARAARYAKEIEDRPSRKRRV